MLVLSIDSINRLPLVVTVVPGTDASNLTRDYPTDVRVPAAASGLPLDTVFRCFQVTVVDQRKFPSQPAGGLSSLYLKKVEDTVRFVLGL